MSESEKDERREYVTSDPNVTTTGTRTVMVQPPGNHEHVEVVTAPSPNVHKEEVVNKRTTNTGALVGVFVGIVVLGIGMVLVLRETPFLPYPYSLFAIIVVGLALIAVGASLVANRTAVR
jgi:uncharacterized membrane protein